MAHWEKTVLVQLGFEQPEPLAGLPARGGSFSVKASKWA